MHVLFAERRVEAVKVPGGGDVRGGCPFAKHLLDGVSRDKVNEKEYKAHYQPDHWQGVEDALEKGFQSRSL
jgi:hypothetical protein